MHHPTNLHFTTVLLPGILSRTPADGTNFLRFETSGRLVSKHNEAERGTVLSELTLSQSQLLSFDDRTGTVFDLAKSLNDGSEFSAVPRLVITEVDGDTDKGMKWEWAVGKIDTVNCIVLKQILLQVALHKKNLQKLGF